VLVVDVGGAGGDGDGRRLAACCEIASISI